jgi:hypothetical protein
LGDCQASSKNLLACLALIPRNFTTPEGIYHLLFFRNLRSPKIINAGKFTASVSPPLWFFYAARRTTPHRFVVEFRAAIFAILDHFIFNFENYFFIFLFQKFFQQNIFLNSLPYSPV